MTAISHLIFVPNAFVGMATMLANINLVIIGDKLSLIINSTGRSEKISSSMHFNVHILFFCCCYTSKWDTELGAL